MPVSAKSISVFILCGTAAVMLVTSSSIGPVWAQAPERGSFWGRAAPQTRDDTQDRDAARLYADARADMDTGQQSSAQRRLEVLVARYPASPLADVARRDLQQLYQAALSGAPAQPAAPTATQAATTRTIAIAPVAVQPKLPVTGPVTAPASTPPPAGARDASDEFRQLAGDRIFFADSSIDLGGRARGALEAQAAWLARHPGIEIVIEGHGDDHGNRDFNRDLSEKRAQSVKLRLADLGVAADRITVVSFGRDRPVADCAEAHCTAQNRRVVTILTRVPAGLGFDPTRTAAPAGVPAGVPIR